MRSQEFSEQRSPTIRGKRLRAREYALNSDEAFLLRVRPEFAGEELHDAEISRLVGIYRSTKKKVFRFPKAA